MPEYSSNDINDARRRVEEMRRRAKNYVDEADGNHNVNNQSHNTKSAQNEKSQAASPKKSPSFDLGFVGDIVSSLFSNDNENDNTTALLLALILILTKEGADNKLILALLYILL